MRFFRAHGLGNDYLVAPAEFRPDPGAVRSICDRHAGAGSDGILLPCGPREGADCGLRIFNPDGSEAEKSGNGLRIFGWWRHHVAGGPAAFTAWTAGGVVRVEVSGDQVCVDMGPARVGPEVEILGVRATPVDVGNPHRVVLETPAEWRALGAAIEHAVPGRTNVQFVDVRDGIAHVLCWERGAGETLASGSSACAVAAVVVARRLLPSPVTTRFPGGDLVVDVAATLRLRGPVEPIGSVELHPAWLASRGIASIPPS